MSINMKQIVVYLYNGFSSAIKKEQTTDTCSTIITLSERGQIRKTTYYMIPFIQRSEKGKP